MAKQAPVTKIEVPMHKSLQELKALNNPPVAVMTVCRMAFTLLYGSEKQNISWSECKPFIANPKALAQTMEQVSDFDISSKDPYLIQLAIQMLEEA